MRHSLLVLASALVAGAAVTTASAAVKPKPWQWTTAQASAALMRQAEDFYVETTERGYKMPRDLVSATCRGTGKRVARRYLAFTCTATAQRGAADPLLKMRVLAKTRRAGGLCWAVAPARIPLNCLAAGRRAEGSVEDAFGAMFRLVNFQGTEDFRCQPHGAGYFSCEWTIGDVTHRGFVVFKPSPVAKVLS